MFYQFIKWQTESGKKKNGTATRAASTAEKTSNRKEPESAHFSTFNQRLFFLRKPSRAKNTHEDEANRSNRLQLRFNRLFLRQQKGNESKRKKILKSKHIFHCQHRSSDERQMNIPDVWIGAHYALHDAPVPCTYWSLVCFVCSVEATSRQSADCVRV